MGRYDNVINSGGVKLFPEQIEKKLSKIISHRFFVFGLKNEKLGEKLVLIIESNRELFYDKNDFLKCGLNKFEFPKEIFTINEFVETESGKIQRKATLKLI